MACRPEKMHGAARLVGAQPQIFCEWLTEGQSPSAHRAAEPKAEDQLSTEWKTAVASDLFQTPDLDTEFFTVMQERLAFECGQAMGFDHV